MAEVVLVHGTFGRPHPWHHPGGLVAAELEVLGHSVLDFCWSGLLAGVPTTLPGDSRQAQVGADQGDLLPWLDAGEKLLYFCEVNHLERPCVVSHSHGLQVVAFSCWAGAAYDTAISISGPIRRDMQRARRYAKTRIARWVQFADPDTDWTIKEGELFDGVLGEPVELPEGETILTPGSGHSGLLNDAGLRAHYKPWDALPLRVAYG